MGKVNFTESQKRAINFGDKNLLLSAAAGSGKTACLSARIVELVGQGRADISEMLIVTFTKAATAEMCGRIASAMRNEAAECRISDPARAERLRRNANKIGSAEISTIHSFLYKNIKKYFPAVGFPGDSGIIDENRADSIKRRIIKQIIDREFEKTANITAGEDNSFVLLANTIGITRDSEKIDEEILWILERMGEDCGVNDYSSAMNEISLGTDIMETAFADNIKKIVSDFVLCYSGIFDEFSKKIAEYTEIDKKYRAAIEGDLAWCRNVLEKLRVKDLKYDSLKETIAGYSPVRLGNVTEKYKNEICSEYKHFRDLFKNGITYILGTYFCYSAVENKKSAEKICKITQKINEIAREYRAELERHKVKTASIEYDDLERIALKLFRDENGQPTAIAHEIGSKYKYIFVDEYQDTNDVQDLIFSAISENAVRFMVGDIKQSIYRFRGAEPAVFKRYRDQWGINHSENEAEFDSSDGESIFLSENFRCDGPVIDFTNAVSRNTLRYGGIGYLPEDDLIKGKIGGGEEPVEILMLDKKSVQNEDEDGDGVEEEFDEPTVIARIISDMVGRYSYDGDKIIRPKDIAVIMRSPGTSAERYKSALARFGIPANSAKSIPAEEFASVKLLLCLLNFVDNPLREIYTVGALVSPIFDFTPSDIVSLRQLSDDFIFKTVCEISRGNADVSDDLRNKCIRAESWYDREKTIVSGVSLSDYIEYLINNNEINNIHEVMEDPLEADALRAFAQKAREFENSSPNPQNCSLSAFLRSVKDDDGRGHPDGNNKIEEDGDAVSILSIHASKGLEFPVVIIAECGKKRNSGDETRTVLVDKLFGISMMLPSEKGLERYDNIFRRLTAAYIRNESLNEEMRMLYVALTRARNKLIITSSVSDSEKKLTRLAIENKYRDEYLVKGKSTYIDWLLSSSIGTELDGRVKVNVIRSDGMIDNELSADGEELSDGVYDVSEDIALISERFDMLPREGYLSDIPSKLSVSELSGGVLDKKDISTADADSDGEAEEIEKPSFMLSEKFATAADRGNAVHIFMQFADFSRLAKTGFEAEAECLIRDKFISDEQYKLINRRQIERFIDSSLFDKITRSDFVKREFRFNALIDASRFTEDDELKRTLDLSQTKITIQGVVDCVFRDPDSKRLVLVDYKTDTLTSEEWADVSLAEKKLRERHRNQLTYYREICSEMFGEDICEVYVYSTVLGRLIAI